MYRRTQTQYKIYGSINTHRVSREIAPDLNCSGPSVLAKRRLHVLATNMARLMRDALTRKNVTAD